MTELLAVEPLTSRFGAIVGDVDLGRRLEDSHVEDLRTLLDERSLLVIRDPNVTADDQVRLVRALGVPYGDRRAELLDDHLDGTFCSFVSNVHPDAIIRDGRLDFHSDNMFTESPVLMLSLYATQTAGESAPTRFASTMGAYDALDDELRERLASLSAVNVVDFTPEGMADYGRTRINDGGDYPEYSFPRATHPVVDTHPRSGRPFLTVGHFLTSHITDVGSDESEALLEQLFGALYAPENVYEHQWRRGDLLIWDNLALQHGRPDWPKSAARTLRRVGVCQQQTLESFGDTAAFAGAAG